MFQWKTKFPSRPSPPTPEQQKEDLEKQLRDLKKSSDHDIYKYRGRAAKLEKEVKKLKDYIEQTRKSAEANRKLSLELEREKGRLAGIIYFYLDYLWAPF